MNFLYLDRNNHYIHCLFHQSIHHTIHYEYHLSFRQMSLTHHCNHFQN